MSLTGFFSGIGDALTQVATASVPLAQTAIQAKLAPRTMSYSPYGAGSAFTAGAVTGLASGGPLAGTQVDLGLPSLELPFRDLAPQGAGVAFEPFRTSRDGRQTAKPFMAVRSSGAVEWFIPAGKPQTWSKASVKRRRCRPR